MSGLIKISEAASMAIHALMILAGTPDKYLTTHEIAEFLKVSENHLSKVMMSLRRARLVKSVRGPGGGSSLARPCEEITLREIYEAMEGPMDSRGCLLNLPLCKGRRCKLGGFVQAAEKKFQEYLGKTRLCDLSHFFNPAEQG